MAAHFLIVAVAACTLFNPTVEWVASEFPKFEPLAITVTITDIGCAAVTPTIQNVVAIIGDIRQVVLDAPPHHIGR